MGQALQLAYPNDQAPDVHALAGVNLPIPALKKEGWFAPLEPHIDAEWKSSLPESIFVEGRTTFNGELYSFPIFSFRWHEALVWYDNQVLEDAGYDPAIGPRTWDEFRDAAKKITDNGGGTVFGWMQGVGHIGRMSATLTRLAHLAGASGEIGWTTGEYAHGSDAYVNALEFLVSMERDGSLFPTGITIDTRNARARWAAGSGGLFMDGPWNPGVLQGNFPEFMDLSALLKRQCPTWIHLRSRTRFPRVVTSGFRHNRSIPSTAQPFCSNSPQKITRFVWQNAWTNRRSISIRSLKLTCITRIPNAWTFSAILCGCHLIH